MDFGSYQQRYVALELSYVGWGCGGFARQDTCENTIEGHFFRALVKGRLIPDGVDWKTLKYSRCGRTDKGVSALGQVVALLLRSAAKTPAVNSSMSHSAAPTDCVGATATASPAAAAATASAIAATATAVVDEADAPATVSTLPAPEHELDYVRIINASLPPDIRVLGWADVSPDFSARFTSDSRQYKYWITDRGDLDVAAMRTAGAALVGEHDFRNFCKADVENVRSFVRRVLDVRIEATGPVLAPGTAASPTCPQLYGVTIRGSAFLWHQVRCLVAVLLMVGRGQEEPGIVARLLDVTATPCKPQYAMADEEPLLLHAATFREPLAWHRRVRGAESILEVWRTAMERHLVGAAMLSAMQHKLQADLDVLTRDGSFVTEPLKVPPPHIPLLKRQMEPSVEERLRRRGLPALGQASGEDPELGDD